MKDLREKLAFSSVRTISLFLGVEGLNIGVINVGSQIIWANNMKKDAYESCILHINRGEVNSFIC